MAPAPQAGQHQPMTSRLLIVEDSDLIRARLLMLLGSVPGISSMVAVATRRAALESARRDPPTLVILDLNLPDGQGMEIVQQLKQFSPLLRIAILTIHTYQSVRLCCLAQGADWFFDKDSEVDLLLDVVRQQVELNRQ
jgi:DNA-binding NarL/FixJ family response regulator